MVRQFKKINFSEKINQNPNSSRTAQRIAIQKYFLSIFSENRRFSSGGRRPLRARARSKVLFFDSFFSFLLTFLENQRAARAVFLWIYFFSSNLPVFLSHGPVLGSSDGRRYRAVLLVWPIFSIKRGRARARPRVGAALAAYAPRRAARA